MGSNFNARVKEYIDLDGLTHYLLSRRNPDGGFCFYGLDESGLFDTYHAMLILEAIGRIPDDGKTVEYLQRFQSNDGRFTSPYTATYVMKALSAIGETLLCDPGDYVRNISRSCRIPDTVYIESASIFESVAIVIDLCTMLDMDEPCREIADKVASHVREDGSYGGNDPSLVSTYYAVRILKAGRKALQDPLQTAGWVKSHAIPSGGFAKKPYTGMAFMDETYYAPKYVRPFEAFMTDTNTIVECKLIIWRG